MAPTPPESQGTSSHPSNQESSPLRAPDFAERKVSALLEANKAILEETDFATAAHRIFDACRELTGASSGYVALLSPDGEENELLFLEAGGLPCTVDPSLPMPIRGLRADAYRLRKTVYDNDFMHSHWMEFIPAGHVDLRNVMFAPLIIEDRAVGLLGLANKDGAFTNEDADAAGALGELAAIALRNSRTREELARTNQLLAATGAVARVGGFELKPTSGELLWTAEVRRLHEVPDEFEPTLATALDFYLPEDQAVLRQAVDRALEDGTPYDLELRLRTAKGRVRWVHTRGQLVAGQETPARLVGTVQDITRRKRLEEERRRLEEKVQQSQKLESLGVLAGGIAHDFNNLLMAVLGNASLALSSISPVSPVSSYLQEIDTAARRASDLSRQMLSYSGHGAFVVGPVSLNEVVEEMTHLMEVSISKTAVLKLDLTAGLPHVQADATQIRQIVMNLITNASDAIGDRSGVISVVSGAMECSRHYLESTFLDEDLTPGLYVYLEVSDTGCGMDADTQARIFDPFFTTKFTGRGLGLAAVLGIVRGHRGAIKVYSEPGKGTAFKVLFPVEEEEVHQPSLAPAFDVSSWCGQGAVLFVDDDETSRAVGARLLQRIGFDVTLATDGKEGLALFRERSEAFCMVLLDLTMPHMDGRRAFSEMRLVNAEVPIVITSGYAEKEVSTQFAGKGLAGFIQKPFDLQTLRTVCRNALASKD